MWKIIGKIMSTGAGILLILIGIIGLPVPIFPGFIFIILGASLLGIPIVSKIKKMIRKESSKRKIVKILLNINNL